MKLLFLLLAASALVSCESPAAGALARIGIDYGARRGVLNDLDAEALRSAAGVLLPPVTAAKNPRVDLQP